MSERGRVEIDLMTNALMNELEPEGVEVGIPVWRRAAVAARDVLDRYRQQTPETPVAALNAVLAEVEEHRAALRRLATGEPNG